MYFVSVCTMFWALRRAKFWLLISRFSSDSYPSYLLNFHSYVQAKLAFVYAFFANVVYINSEIVFRSSYFGYGGEGATRTPHLMQADKEPVPTTPAPHFST